MFWKRNEPPPPLPDPGPSNAAVMEQLDIFRRALKRFETELDLATAEHAAIRARVTKMLNRVDKAAQDAPGSTIDHPEGVTPPPTTPGPREDGWTAAARIARARADQRHVPSKAG